MRRILLGLVVGVLAVFSHAGSEGRLSPPAIETQVENDLLEWLRNNGRSPEAYVLSKFADHDIVFLGEYHRIRHDPLLVQNLIPLLYKEGIRNLGIEFACAHDQEDIDRLLSMDSYDRELANAIFWRQWPFWGYQEYIDILHAAWTLNQSLSQGQPPFRVIGLNARMDWSHIWSNEDREDPEIRKLAFPDGDSDKVMAETIRREILARDEKALVYSGINHAYTRFQQPIVDEKSGKLVRLVSNRMGNRIYAEVGPRSFTIFLHAPWPSVAGYSEPWIYAAGGVIDAVFARLGPDEQRMGFDILDSPFGDLGDTSSYWSHCAEDFRLCMYCDGWIFQKPLSDYVGVTPVEAWFTEENRLEAIAQISNPNPRVKNNERTVEDLTSILAADADIKHRFAHLR